MISPLGGDNDIAVIGSGDTGDSEREGRQKQDQSAHGELLEGLGNQAMGSGAGFTVKAAVRE
ncbi:hypothetical protein [Deinococcus sp.]|uniref:hypothetical protein n=1 Tax=Deinococcus sp. TaxID=47478 RepID=UPI0025F1CEB1|nr:hypothetical protein [Deinococcus sp.]